MNSLRPLVTITTVFVVGAFIWVKLNEGPPRQAPAANQEWPTNLSADVPPLDAAAGRPAVSTEAAPPAWPGTPTEAPAPATTADVSATAPPLEPSAITPAIEPAAPPAEAVAGSPPELPAMPAMPELPQLSPQTSPSAPANPAVETPTQLPANIPTARYPDQVAGADASTPAAATVTAPALAPAAPAPTDASAAPPTTPVDMPQTPEAANAQSAANMILETQPLAAQQNPLRTTAPDAAVDRYAVATLGTPAAPNAAAITPVGQTFATSWPGIQAALERGDLADAHQQLTRWYHDPSLTPTDAERVDSLLSQLAGTVVYSTEHRLEPPYVVKQGETLEAIAQQYNVPSQLLAKINGVSSPDALKAGQELKVVRGPFNAIVDLDHKELVLMLGERYAGRFALTAPPSSTVSEGEWHVARVHNQHILLIGGDGKTPPTSTLQVPILLGSNPGALGADFAHVGANGEFANVPAGEIAISASDAAELQDILATGSKVLIKR